MTLPDVLLCKFIKFSNRFVVFPTACGRSEIPVFRKTSIACTLAASVCLAGSAALANGLDLLKPDSFYAGFGTGLSYLNPKDDSSEYQVVDRKDIAAQLFLGVDTTRRSAVELQYSDLGTAELSDNASLGYQEASLSGLLYGLPQIGAVLAGGSGDIKNKRGLYAFGRAGVGKLFTDASNLNHRQENDYHLLLGAGAELGFANNLALRAEYLSYDHDAKYLQLSLLYRLQPKQQPLIQETPDRAVITVPESPVPLVSTPPRQYQDTIEGVNFVTNSAELTPNARIILNAAAIELNKYPNMLVWINAHTDNRGAALFNLDLSARRALSTANYLRLLGVAPDRLIPQAFGETSPLASNATAAGRYLNRRVEFKTAGRN